jgi:uncharacterized protein UPF0270
MPQGSGVVVLHDWLTPEALPSLADEFVTREGTDYGPVESWTAIGLCRAHVDLMPPILASVKRPRRVPRRCAILSP